jgi:hypothetical protein
MGHPDDASMLMSLLPWLIISIFFGWGNYLLATKSARSGILYAALTIIPLVGFVVTVYLLYSCIIRLLDQQEKQQRQQPAT